MTSLKQRINSIKQLHEDGAGGAVGAGSIAAGAMPLFTNMIQRSASATSIPKVIQYSKTGLPKNSQKKKTTKGKLNIREAFYSISEGMGGSEGAFDNTEVISKLKGLENKESVDYRDTSTFGLVDANGDIVRVTIPTDQAQGFEQDIQHMLGDRDESEPSPEIAEVLFDMKDRYTIITVDWPQVEEDAEEGQELQGSKAGEEGGVADLPGDDEGMGDAGLPPAGGTPPVGGADTTQVTDLLTQVIDMMKADAEARKSEAQAREAEANNKQAIAARDHGINRVKQEEQYLEMDQYNKAQKEKDKEAKRLAQLSKWKHDMANDKGGNRPAQEPSYDFNPGEEEEESIFNRPQSLKPQQSNRPNSLQGKVSASDIAKFIANRTR